MHIRESWSGVRTWWEQILMVSCQGKIRLDIGKGSSPEGGWAWKRLLREAARVQKASVQCSQVYGLIFEWSCEEPIIGFDDPCVSLPAQDIL